MSKEAQFQWKKDMLRKRLLKYTRRAFRMLPILDKPRILDVGCGSGIPTTELARLSNGEVIGIDIDQPALDRLTQKIIELGFSDRVRAVNRSILDMDFSEASFDIIWSEGSIFVIGFEKGLREWRRFLKTGGFMVIHDEEGNVTQKLKQISNCDYELLGYFRISEQTWWNEYFAPLEKLISDTKTIYADSPKILVEFQNAQQEIDMFRKNPERNRSVCFAIRKLTRET